MNYPQGVIQIVATELSTGRRLGTVSAVIRPGGATTAWIRVRTHRAARRVRRKDGIACRSPPSPPDELKRPRALGRRATSRATPGRAGVRRRRSPRGRSLGNRDRPRHARRPAPPVVQGARRRRAGGDGAKTSRSAATGIAAGHGCSSSKTRTRRSALFRQPARDGRSEHPVCTPACRSRSKGVGDRRASRSPTARSVHSPIGSSTCAEAPRAPDIA